jgi:hypothetical protein
LRDGAAPHINVRHAVSPAELPMTRADWILALTALIAWVAAYAWFFGRNIRRWLQQIRPMREQARKERAEREAAQARLREELAAKYLPPRPGARPPA